MQSAMERVPRVLADASREWAGITGRLHRAIETYRMDDAEVALVTAGSIGGTAHAAVDRLREDGMAVGLVRLRLFRPFPAREIAEALSGVDRVAVIDRNCSIGSGGIIGGEVRAALAALGEMDALVFSYVAGLGGVNVAVERVMQIARDAVRRRWPALAPILEEALLEQT
jgi:pyruvate/2-oxoacid:ferredoxin oxidoreductase alpha subunit